jgi:glycosyltransferase involved in cell wall biosynthesis
MTGERLRILQAMAGAAHGGAELFFERLVLALHRAGVQQHVLIRENAERAGKLVEGGLQPVELAFGGRFDWSSKRRFAKEIKKFQPQVVLSWMNRATSFTPPKTTGAGFIHVARLGGYYDLKYYQKCDHLACNTHDLVDYVVREGWPAERAHYLPNFVDERSAPPVSRREFYTPDSVPLLFALGRLHQNKGFDTLLKAVSRISDLYLWIAGDGPEREALESLAHQLGIKPRVRFLGWRDDAPALHAAADLFVCPSRHEPLGNVVIEAWAQGAPVLAAASQGPTELIEPGVNGILTPIDDPVAMAEAIRKAVRDPDDLARMAAAGRQAFEARFTEAAVVAQYRAFFEQVIAQKAAETAS